MRRLDEQETTQMLRGYHQLIYAISGTTQIETERVR